VTPSILTVLTSFIPFNVGGGVIFPDFHVLGDIEFQVNIRHPLLGLFDFSLPAFNIRRRDYAVLVISKFHHFVSTGSWFEIGGTDIIR